MDLTGGNIQRGGITCSPPRKFYLYLGMDPWFRGLKVYETEQKRIEIYVLWKSRWSMDQDEGFESFRLWQATQKLVITLLCATCAP
jgi:hypothetical protein